MGAKWLTTIKFDSFKKDKKDFYGFYNKGKKRIIFNKKNMNKTGKDINNDGLNNFVKFAHEFTHALCKDENGMDI